MSTFKDFLVWYNNLDVVPFIEAVEKMSQFWQERKIDMFKDGISVPGLTLKYLFSFLGHQTYFSLFDQANSDLYHLTKKTTTQAGLVSFFIATMKPAKQRSGKQRKARLLSYVKKSWGMTLTPCTSGRSYKICQREVIRDAWRKMSLNPREA